MPSAFIIHACPEHGPQDITGGLCTQWSATTVRGYCGIPTVPIRVFHEADVRPLYEELDTVARHSSTSAFPGVAIALERFPAPEGWVAVALEEKG